MEITARTYTLNIILAFIPDLLVCWIAARITDSGWTGFFVALLSLQAIYFFFWFKQAAWGWVLFWLYGKHQMAKHLHSFFGQAAFPSPNAYTKDLDDYLPEIINNEDLECTTRVTAAGEQGTLNGFRAARRFSIAIQLNSAAAIAIDQYRRTYKTPQKQDRGGSDKSSVVSLEMGKRDLDTIAWLADRGFRVCIHPHTLPIRSDTQISEPLAERFASLLDTFERKIVPNLLIETDEDKERRFSACENRMKDVWDSYPAPRAE